MGGVRRKLASWDSTKREVECIAENCLAAESKHRHNSKEVGTGLGRFDGGDKKSAGQKTKTIREFRSKDSTTMENSPNFIVRLFQDETQMTEVMDRKTF